MSAKLQEVIQRYEITSFSRHYGCSNMLQSVIGNTGAALSIGRGDFQPLTWNSRTIRVRFTWPAKFSYFSGIFACVQPMWHAKCSYHHITKASWQFGATKVPSASNQHAFSSWVVDPKNPLILVQKLKFPVKKFTTYLCTQPTDYVRYLKIRISSQHIMAIKKLSEDGVTQVPN